MSLQELVKGPLESSGLEGNSPHLQDAQQNQQCPGTGLFRIINTSLEGASKIIQSDRSW